MRPHPTRARAGTTALSLLVLLAICVHPALAVVEPEGSSPLASYSFSDPDLHIANYHRPISELPSKAGSLGALLRALGVEPSASFVDGRGGRVGTLVLSLPLIPGKGAGNDLTWTKLGAVAPAGMAAYKDTAWVAFKRFLAAHPGLGVDAAELTGHPTVAVHENGRLVHIHASREIGGVPVRDSFVTATINSGNLVLFGTRNWGKVDVALRPTKSKEQAAAALESHVSPHAVTRIEKSTLVLVPTANGRDLAKVAFGDGYRYRLAWSVMARIAGSDGSWEALVDAHSGELFSFADRNLYLTRRTYGGIFPVSNDGESPGGVPDGIEQPRHPMPFATLVLGDGTTTTTNSAGLADFDGPFGTDLTGPFVRISDSCGFINEVTSCQDLDLRTSPGTDCETPPGASLGNTHSSRTGFYELNRIIEQAKGWVSPADPANVWLNSQLTANMNIDANCNANFNFVTGHINFYTSGSSGTNVCRNTGEIAAVFDHEWGHGLDFNDGNSLSTPSEAYADIASILRLNTSCIGRGFFIDNSIGGFCTGNGDPCTECTGVREDDWMKRQSGRPHDIDWALGQNPNVPGACGGTGVPTPVLTGPCGGGVHCEGQIAGEAVWDMLKRDLRCQGIGWEEGGLGNVGGGQCVGGAAPTMSENTALEVTARIFYLAKGQIGFWFQCDPDFGGCNADGGYLQFLAADDDNGNLADGTPHGAAIFDAWNRHQAACSLINPGRGLLSCAATPEPATAPVVSAIATVNGAEVSWTSVPGAAEYWLFRTEGVHGCDFGKERIAVTADTAFSDSGLLDGLEYFYSVIPVGGALGVPAPACTGPMSECASVTPLSPASGGGGDASVAVAKAGVTIETGDGDEFVDNCETAELDFTVTNNGAVTLTNVQVVDVRATSHPQTGILTAVPFGLPDLANACDSTAGSAAASFRFKARGLAHDDTLVFEVDVLADQFGGVPQTGTMIVTETESDFVLVSEVLFDFEDGTQGWETFTGTFDRTNTPPPGAELTSFYMASSAAQDFACDRSRSPELVLSATSTLSLHSQFITEPNTGSWYDRANVGIIDENGARTLITPSGGRLYNAFSGPGNYAGCNDPEEGWATGPEHPDAGVNWGESTWDANALGGASFAGQKVRIEVISATDSTASLRGFWFDQVKVTDVLVRGADQQSDDCPNQPPVAVDDKAKTRQGKSVDIDVLANDSDPDNDGLTVTDVTDPPNGTATNNGDGTVTYTPDPGFFGTDTFQYTVCDGPGACDTATVTVKVLRRTDDDDDQDSDGKRDDEDSDDDNDGKKDDEDSDDDNDGKRDDEDSDDDNDGIDDEFDNQGLREEQHSGSGQLGGGGAEDYPLASDAGTLLLTALAESPSIGLLVVEIYDPAGNLVAASVPAPGRALATTVPLSSGTYTARVRNLGATPVTYSITLITQASWL